MEKNIYLIPLQLELLTPRPLSRGEGQVPR